MPSTPRLGLADLAVLVPEPEPEPDYYNGFHVHFTKGAAHASCLTCGWQSDSRRDPDHLTNVLNHDCEED